jgi:pyruvate dehydrogenase E2 component (dihydrolipoamide acetyltransferase)
MRFEMKMPDLATTDSLIRIVRWLIEPGQRIERGRPLLEVETDKATMEVESVVSGVLVVARSSVDDEVSVGDVIAVLEVAEAPQPAGPRQTPTAAAPMAAGPPAPTPSPPGGMFARNRARRKGTVPFSTSENGDSPPGEDRASPQVTPPDAGIPLSVAQRTAARRLQESKQTIPHFYLQTSVNAAAVIARRKAAEPAKLAWDAFIVLAVARAIGRFDRFCCRLEGERLLRPQTDAIGVAIDHGGELYVIPIAGPAAKTVEEISAEIRQSVERLRSGDPEMRLIRPALMTVTNLGVCNVESFIPIINPPEAAILGVGKVVPTAVVLADGRIGVEHRSTLTLCADHRIVSGRYAGDFLAAIVKEMESF